MVTIWIHHPNQTPFSVLSPTLAVGGQESDFDGDSLNAGCWSHLLDTSDLDPLPESEDLLTDDATDPLGMDTPLYPGSHFSVAEF